MTLDSTDDESTPVVAAKEDPKEVFKKVSCGLVKGVYKPFTNRLQIYAGSLSSLHTGITLASSLVALYENASPINM